MRFGLQIETYGEEDSFGRMLAVARPAEEVGFESVWYEDHFSVVDDERPEEPWPQLECMTTLAALAASTETVGIGALVVGVPYRNPALLRKMWTTIDAISRGRAIVGLGAGWNEQEFEAYGYRFPSVGERMEMLEDAIRVRVARANCFTRCADPTRPVWITFAYPARGPSCAVGSTSG